MRRRWRKLYTLIVLSMAFSIALEAVAQAPLNQVMRNKLIFSQRLLEGIALADFKKITKNTEELISLSNTAEWLAFKTPRYAGHSDEFRAAAEKILQKSRDKNIDGVTLAYMGLTMSCVRCHEYVREIRDARAPLDPASVAVIRPE